MVRVREFLDSSRQSSHGKVGIIFCGQTEASDMSIGPS